MDRQLGSIFCSARQVMIAFIVALLYWCPLWGLDPDTPIAQYLVNQWGIAEGISSNWVLSIAQTPDGYLWIATSKGLVRFDGIKFSTLRFAGERETAPLESTIPDTLFVDREGTLWIGSSVGLTSYQHKTGQFKTFTSADGITKDRIRRIEDDMRGNLWISFFASYVNRFSNGKFFAFNASHGLEGKKINAIVEDQKGNLLFGTRENGVFTYRDGKFSRYPIADLGSAQIIIMHEDRKGVLWIGTNNGLLQVTDKGTRRCTTQDGLSNDHITYIAEDSDYNLWIGTAKGLNRIKKKQDGAIGFESMLKESTITCLFEDREKNVWVGTYDSGIKRLKNSIFLSYAPLQMPREEILLSLFEDREGDTWIGTLSGKLFRCRGSDFIESVEVPGIADTGITAIADDDVGNLWLGTNGKGVFQKKDGTFVQLTDREGLADNLVTSISRDSKNNLWISTFDGVSRYSNGVIESLKPGDGLSGKGVHNVYEDKNQNIWIATDKGITVLKNGEITKENITYYLQDVSVTCIYEDLSASGDKGSENSVFWIATHGAGLKRFKDGTFTSYTTAEGMTTNFIYQFFEGPQGNFWFMSNSGILRVSKKELNQLADQRGSGMEQLNCTSFGIPDGMESIEFNNEFSRHSALKTKNGEIWFITKKGITIVNPGTIQINKLPPPVVIEAVLFDEQPVSLHLDEDAYRFKGITDFQFHFTALTFISPEKIKFKYRLEGIDTRWRYLLPGKERSARYKDLEPGTYTFRVLACNSDGVWNQTGDSMTFTLKPFFYESILFKILVVIMLIILLAAAFYIYKKRPFDKRVKYKGATLNPKFAEVCIQKLRHLMETEKEYRDPDISLQSLAKKMSITSHVLSQLLNEKLNRNFSDFINFYRIEEAKQILQSPKAEEQKIITVAFDVGFNTKVAFYNAFKKYTNMTPSEYRKKAGSEE